RPICLRFEIQAARRPESFADAKAGSSSAARRAMMEITTRSSVKVNPLPRKCVSGAQNLFRFAARGACAVTFITLGRLVKRNGRGRALLDCDFAVLDFFAPPFIPTVTFGPGKTGCPDLCR